MEATVGILITNYNHKSFVVDCIKSVINQSYQNWKAVIVDDCSTDGSPEVIKGLIEGEPRFMLVQNEVNLGQPKSLNRIAPLVYDCDCVAFLDSDDFWLPEKLQKQLNVFKNNPGVNVVYCDGILKDERTTVDQAWGNIKGKQFFSDIHRTPKRRNGMLFNELLDGNFMFRSSVMMKIKPFKTIEFHSNIIPEDWVLWLELAPDNKFSYIETPMVYYRIHGNNFQNQVYSTSKENSRSFVLSKYRDQMPSKTVSKHYYGIARQLLSGGKIQSHREFFIHLLGGFMYNPFSLYGLKLVLIYFKNLVI